MKLYEIQDLMRTIRYEHWQFHILDDNGRMFLQIKFWDVDNDTGKLELQSCRKWMLSEHMTKSEVVLTAWKAVQAAVEHEAREKFLYKGRRVFGPHIDLDAMWAVSTNLDARAKV
jgi:hypothetical protein